MDQRLCRPLRGGGLLLWEVFMETRVAVISVILDDEKAAPALNALLHENRKWIIGRLGIPYKQKNVCIVSVALDAPQDVTAALAGKIGRLPGASAKAAYSSLVTQEQEDKI